MNASKEIVDIVNGYSLLEVSGEHFFFKHPSVHAKINESLIVDEIRQKGINNGILSEADLLKQAIDAGVWSEEKDEEIKEIKWLIDKQERQLDRKISDPSTRKSLERDIEENKAKIEEILREKSAISYYSLENYVATKAPVALCRNEVFRDPEFKEGIVDASPDIIRAYIGACNRLFDRDNILYAAYHPLFFELASTSKFNPCMIFGGTIKTITVLQKEICSYGKILYDKLVAFSDIPSKTLEDAVLLYKYQPKKEERTKPKEEISDMRGYIEVRGGADMKPEDKLR